MDISNSNFFIVHRKKYKQLEDLKGCKYAFNSKDSVSGYILPLLELKKKGYNSSFFSNMLESGKYYLCSKIT